MNTEIWKPIKGHEDYQISNMGRILSFKKIDAPKILKQQTKGPNLVNGSSYMSVFLCKDGVAKKHNVHKLVALTFLGPPTIPNQNTVHHINHDKCDNRVENLEWKSEKCNIRESFGYDENRNWIVADPNGKHHIVDKPSVFANMHGLNAGSFSGLINRSTRTDGRNKPFRIRSTRGWTLVKEYDSVTGKVVYMRN